MAAAEERSERAETQLKEGGMQQITKLKQRVEELESLLEKAHFKRANILSFRLTPLC
jgi:hypothetical protein